MPDLNAKRMKDHAWIFFRAGGAWQVKISRGSDIANIGSLDEKLWSALACPVDGLVFDRKTLEILDSDGDNKIRRMEVVAACEWACSMLKNPDTLISSPGKLSLANIDDSGKEGASILASAKKILSNLGKAEAEDISVGDFSEPSKTFSASAFNGDGIITAESCQCDADCKSVIADVITYTGGSTDRSGNAGADALQIEKFFEDARAFISWLDIPKSHPEILPLGESTSTAYAAYAAVKDKIDDWFERRALLSYDKSSESGLNAKTDEISAALALDGDAKTDALARLPIAEVSDESDSIAFDAPVNPAWQAAYSNFVKSAAIPLAENGDSELSRRLWEKIAEKLSPYEEWMKAKPDSPEKISGIENLRSMVKSGIKGRLLELVEKDLSLKPEADALDNVEKLVRLHANLFRFLENFASFQSLYRDSSGADFMFGKLYIDRRVCKMCIKVSDSARHSSMAPLSYGYILVCSCKRKGEADICVSALVSAGDSDNLMPGRNGIFVDSLGREWDATVVKIIDNPIGVAQAFWSPYKRCVRWASDQIAKRLASNDISPAGGDGIIKTAKKIDVGTVAALGVAVGGITTAFGMALEALFGLGYWLPLGILGIFLAISLPSMLIAWMKLSARNLAPLLDANGWAVNNCLKISMPFGKLLTETASIPSGSKLEIAKCQPAKKNAQSRSGHNRDIL